MWRIFLCSCVCDFSHFIAILARIWKNTCGAGSNGRSCDGRVGGRDDLCLKEGVSSCCSCREQEAERMARVTSLCGVQTFLEVVPACSRGVGAPCNSDQRSVVTCGVSSWWRWCSDFVEGVVGGMYLPLSAPQSNQQYVSTTQC